MKITEQWSWSDWQFYGTINTKKWQLINWFIWLINSKGVSSLKIMSSNQWPLFFLLLKLSESASFHQESIKIWSVRPNRLPKISVIWWNALKGKWKLDKISKRFKIYFPISLMSLKKIQTDIASWKYNSNCSF